MKKSKPRGEMPNAKPKKEAYKPLTIDVQEKIADAQMHRLKIDCGPSYAEKANYGWVADDLEFVTKIYGHRLYYAISSRMKNTGTITHKYTEHGH